MCCPRTRRTFRQRSSSCAGGSRSSGLSSGFSLPVWCTYSAERIEQQDVPLEFRIISSVLYAGGSWHAVLSGDAHESPFSAAASPESAACTHDAAPGLSSQTARPVDASGVFEAANAATVRAGSRRQSSIGTKETTQAFPTIDPGRRKDRGFCHKRRTVSDALVRPFIVIMLHVLVDGVS